ncbi:MAG: YfhO family protein [Lachnospiraceae bacterium]|nr:YfhO family protein [Lachnospiraceae bacterium]
MKKIIKEKGVYILAFCIPWLLLVVHSIVRQSWPFFDESIMRGDCGKQYYQLCVELWNKVRSGGSLLFSWNAGGGIDFLLNMFYYLFSPFTLIILAVPKAHIADAVQVVMILKWSCMYVTMLYYFMHTKFNTITKNKKFISFVVATVYALSNCILYRLALFNWHDVLILFPIILLLLEKMIRDGSWKLYTLLLWIAILTNFYTAYQLCVFLVIWFVFCINKDTEHKLSRLLTFAGSSLLSGVSAMVVILPSVLNGYNRTSLNEQNLVFLKNIYTNKILFSVWVFFEKMFLFDDTSDAVSINPNMYFSIGALVLVGIYIGIKSDIKIKNIALLLFLIASLFVGKLSYAWHGFSIPHGLFHRILFLFVFMVAFIVMDLFNNIDTIEWKKTAVIMFVELIVLVAAFLHITQFAGFYGYFISFMLFAFYVILMVLYLKKSINLSHFAVVFGVVIVCELLANSIYELQEYNNYSVERFYDTKDTIKLLSDVNMGKDERISVINGLPNDGLLMNKPVQDVFLSYTLGKYIMMSKSLGMPYDDEVSYGLYGASPLINLMNNIHYAVANSDMCVADMDKVKTSGNVALYKNNRTAGLGYMADEKLLDWNYEKLGPFNSQNSFANLSTGEGDIFEIVYPEVDCIATTEIDYDKEMFDKGYYQFDYTVATIDGFEYSVVTVKAPKDMDMYIAADNGNFANTFVFMDDEEVLEGKEEYKQHVIHIGDVKKDQEIKMIISHSTLSDGDSNTLLFQFAAFDEDNYQKVYDKLSANVLDIETMKDDYVKGKITADKDGLMMTSIPAMDGFSVYADGKKTDYKKVGAFIAVPLSAGEHEVEFKYMTPYFKQGAIISLAGILVYVLLCVVALNKRKEDNKKAA